MARSRLFRAVPGEAFRRRPQGWLWTRYWSQASIPFVGTKGLARGSAPSIPNWPALRWIARAGASSPCPPWRPVPMAGRRPVLVAVRLTPGERAD